MASPTGHLAIGFAAKRYAPRIPLIVFLIASYVIDLLFLIFLVMGIENMGNPPWSHSLFMAVVWSVSAGLIALLLTKKSKDAFVLGLVVFSHWVIDFIVWDSLPIFFGMTKGVGLGLFSKIGFSLTNAGLNLSTLIASAVELSLLAIGLILYISHRKNLRKEKKDSFVGTEQNN